MLWNESHASSTTDARCWEILVQLSGPSRRHGASGRALAPEQTEERQAIHLHGGSSTACPGHVLGGARTRRFRRKRGHRRGPSYSRISIHVPSRGGTSPSFSVRLGSGRTSLPRIPSSEPFLSSTSHGFPFHPRKTFLVHPRGSRPESSGRSSTPNRSSSWEQSVPHAASLPTVVEKGRRTIRNPLACHPSVSEASGKGIRDRPELKGGRVSMV